MIHLVCLTKPYNDNDFKLWYKWHKALGIDKIHVFHNDSDLRIDRYVNPPDEYQYIHGWPDQWNLFNKILNENTLKFDNQDIVMFLDDDEFLWYDMNLPLDAALMKQFKMLDCVLVPQILLSTKEIGEQRSRSLIENSFYRRADLSNQGKCILLYNKGNEYDFTKEEQNERGHVPFINGMRYSDVVGSDCSKTTYGLVKYNAPVRLYHYHIKSLDDWKHKLARGSAANEVQFYDEDITKNIWYGGYDVIDLTMLNTAKRLGILR